MENPYSKGTHRQFPGGERVGGLLEARNSEGGGDVRRKKVKNTEVLLL